MRPSLYSVPPADLPSLCTAFGQPVFRGQQLRGWLYERPAGTWEAMTDLPAAFREELAAAYRLRSLEPLETAGDEDGPRKILARLEDGECLETVLLPQGGRRTVCLSSQVGCRFGCAFCASGKGGFGRDLAPWEITEQVALAAEGFGTRPSHVVFMGMGEPLDNLDAVLEAVRRINSPEGFGIGARRITISTCGLPEGIARLARAGLQFELSVSLHAAEDKKREQLMPVNRRYPLDTLLSACGEYARETGRIITFEYVLIRGVNDTPADVGRLIERLRPLPARVNLIPLSPVEEFPGEGTDSARAQEMCRRLTRSGVHATIRFSQGKQYDAACGQLRRRRSGLSV